MLLPSTPMVLGAFVSCNEAHLLSQESFNIFLRPMTGMECFGLVS